MKEIEQNWDLSWLSTNCSSWDQNIEKSSICSTRKVRVEIRFIPKTTLKKFRSTENSFKDLEVLEIYRAIKARGDTGHSAGAVINLIWENQLDGKKLKPVSNKVI